MGNRNCRCDYDTIVASYLVESLFKDIEIIPQVGEQTLENYGN